MRRLLTARFLWRTAGLVAIVAGAAQCATVPVSPPLPTFEEKLSWILRLEDQRVLRDPIPAPPPDPVLQETRQQPRCRRRPRLQTSHGSSQTQARHYAGAPPWR